MAVTSSKQGLASTLSRLSSLANVIISQLQHDAFFHLMGNRTPEIARLYIEDLAAWIQQRITVISSILSR